MGRGRSWFVGLTVVVGVGVAVWLLHPSIGPELKTVSAARLSQSGLVLLNPFPWDAPAISQAQAQQIASRQGPGGPILQTALAEVILTNPSARAPRLCWVVSLPGSLIVSSGPPGSLQRRANWYIVLIDAHTGEFVQGAAGG